MRKRDWTNFRCAECGSDDSFNAVRELCARCYRRGYELARGPRNLRGVPKAVEVEIPGVGVLRGTSTMEPRGNDREVAVKFKRNLIEFPIEFVREVKDDRK